MMLALTILQPYASAIMAGVKPVENRSWRPPQHAIGQRLWIHAGKSRSMMGPFLLREVKALWPEAPAADEYPMGVVLGSVLLAGVDRLSARGECPWSCGPWCWLLEDPQPIEPVAVRGYQGLWEIDPQVIETATPLKSGARGGR